MNPTQLLHGQSILAIGGSSGMGLATALLAANHGAHVTIAGRSAARLNEAVKQIGTGTHTISADIATESGLATILGHETAPYDHVVMTTSANARASSIPATSQEEAQAAFGRYWAAYKVLHHAHKLVRVTGSITLISGSSGRRPAPGYGVWSALHSAIEGLAKAAALELAPVRVNVLSPGGIGMRPDRNLVHHAGEFDDIALAALLVMANPAMTMAVVDVDGGERLGGWSLSPYRQRTPGCDD